MTMPADLVAVIEANAGVTAIVGDRIYPLIVPPQALAGDDRRPCLVYATTSVSRDLTFCATSALKAERFSVDCYAASYDGAKALAEAVIAALVDYSGVSGGSTISAVHLENEIDLMDLEPGLYRRLLSFVVWHS